MYDQKSISMPPTVKVAAAVLGVTLVYFASTALAQDESIHASSIRAILASDRQAHLEGNASIIAANLADQVIEVSAGESHTRSREEIKEFFDSRFETVSYLVWKDRDEPIIRLSEDKTMAWVVRSIEAEVESVHDNEESTRDFTFTSVYTATYELFEEGWKMTSVTSTFAPTSNGG